MWKNREKMNERHKLLHDDTFLSSMLSILLGFLPRVEFRDRERQSGRKHRFSRIFRHFKSIERLKVGERNRHCELDDFKRDVLQATVIEMEDIGSIVISSVYYLKHMIASEQFEAFFESLNAAFMAVDDY